MRGFRLYVSPFAEADEDAVADDDVVEDGDFHDLTGFDDAPCNADIVVTHASLEGRVKRVTDKPLILINNYIGDPKLDTLFNQLTAEHKH